MKPLPSLQKKPIGSWGPGHENITLDQVEGMIVLDVVDGPSGGWLAQRSV